MVYDRRNFFWQGRDCMPSYYSSCFLIRGSRSHRKELVFSERRTLLVCLWRSFLEKCYLWESTHRHNSRCWNYFGAGKDRAQFSCPTNIIKKRPFLTPTLSGHSLTMNELRGCEKKIPFCTAAYIRKSIQDGTNPCTFRYWCQDWHALFHTMAYIRSHVSPSILLSP